MAIFGITPVDSALSALGLNLSQVLMNFLFKENKIGYLAFCIGFCYHIYRCTKQVNYRPLLGHLSIFIACLIIVGTTARKVGTITSAWEAYCPVDSGAQNTFACTPPRLKTQTLKFKIFKSDQEAAHDMPALLSFLTQSIDSFNIGAIAAISRFMPLHAQYLKHPFGVQEIALRLHSQANLGIVDLTLKDKARDFIYTHYLPALIMFKNRPMSSTVAVVPITDLSSYGFFSQTIIDHYSPDGKTEWEDLKTPIKDSMNAHSIWPQAKLLLNAGYPQQSDANMNIDEYFIDALMKTELRTFDEKQVLRLNWLWQAAAALLQSYPYAQGVMNLLIFVFFPIVLCFVLTFARLDFLFYWFKALVWVKSWVLTTALAYWVSLLVANAQALTVGGIKWFWQEPYFALGAGILVYVLPLIMFFIVYRGINFVYQQPIREVNHVSSI